MKNRYFIMGFVLGALLWVAVAQAGPRKKTRIDFDEMNISGQTKKADAVYLFDRGSLKQDDLTSPREDYRKEIIETMFK